METAFAGLSYAHSISSISSIGNHFHLCGIRAFKILESLESSNVKHSIVIERRFRNRIARKFKVGHRNNDEQDVRFREQCERSQDCVQYTKQEEIELRRFEVWRGRGQRLYNGHGVSSELFHTRRKTTGEIAHACLSRMSGSGSFPSPIAHAARDERQACLKHALRRMGILVAEDRDGQGRHSLVLRIQQEVCACPELGREGLAEALLAIATVGAFWYTDLSIT